MLQTEFFKGAICDIALPMDVNLALHVHHSKPCSCVCSAEPEPPLNKQGYNATIPVFWAMSNEVPLCISSILFRFPKDYNLGSHFSRIWYR